ncbi:hypothetical protein BCAR13_940071 [Paraburkholderia caribensis]|nr:hypothetical protein BCAR13_940071 [Paraburkholderia caribensis]
MCPHGRAAFGRLFVFWVLVCVFYLRGHPRVWGYRFVAAAGLVGLSLRRVPRFCFARFKRCCSVF